MNVLAILPALLVCANIATGGVANGGTKTALSSPVSRSDTAGYGRAPLAVDQVELGIATGVGVNHVTQEISTKGIHDATLDAVDANGASLTPETVAVSPVVSPTNPDLVIAGGLLVSGFGNVVDTGTTYSQNTEHVPIPFPHPVPVVVNTPVAVPVTVPQPVDIPRPVHVEVPLPVNVEITKLYPVAVPRQVPILLQKHIYVKVPKFVSVSVPKSYPILIPEPVKVKIPTKMKVPIPVPIHDNHYKHDSYHHYQSYKPLIIPGGLKGGLSSKLKGGLSSGYGSYSYGNYISLQNFSGSGKFSNHHDYHGFGQLYDSNGGYKY